MTTVGAKPHSESGSRRHSLVGKITEFFGSLVLFAVASTGFAYITLAPALDATHPPGGIPVAEDIPCIQERGWIACLVLCVPLFFFTRRWHSFLLGAIAAVVLTLPQFWAIQVNLDRWRQSGVGDGLEQLAIFVPWVVLLAFLMAAAAGRIAAANIDQGAIASCNDAQSTQTGQTP
jgi:hypothetical protein